MLGVTQCSSITDVSSLGQPENGTGARMRDRKYFYCSIMYNIKFMLLIVNISNAGHPTLTSSSGSPLSMSFKL